jgi:hypothetical protein
MVSRLILNAQIAKPLAERHPVMQWYDAYCKYQQATIKSPGEVCNANVTGVVACYLGLAYSLYLLDHNVEIQEPVVGWPRSSPRLMACPIDPPFVHNVWSLDFKYANHQAPRAARTSRRS